MRKVDIKYTLLLDYYGALLPKKQYDIASLYYYDDLSLSEISEDLGITRQGVRDGLARAEASLTGYDEALGLMEKDRVIKDAVQRIKNAARDIKGADEEKLRIIFEACDTVFLKG